MANQQLEDKIEELLRISRGLVFAVEEIRTDQVSIKSDVKANNRKLDTLSGQFNDVANMVIENNGRLTKVEFDVAEIKSNVH
jgi:hypothetical protein